MPVAPYVSTGRAVGAGAGHARPDAGRCLPALRSQDIIGGVPAAAPMRLRMASEDGTRFRAAQASGLRAAMHLMPAAQHVRVAAAVSDAARRRASRRRGLGLAAAVGPGYGCTPARMRSRSTAGRLAAAVGPGCGCTPSAEGLSRRDALRSGRVAHWPATGRAVAA